MKLKLSHLLCIALMACTFVILVDGHAETEEGLASYYGAELAGQPTASGQPFNPYGYTAAHKTLPLGTRLVVNYGGRSVEVTVNDRGPYSGGRELDLSQAAAEYLGLTQAGVDYVDYAVVRGGGYGATYGSGYSTYSGTENYSPGARSGLDGGTYVVQPGDTLSGIAAQMGTTVEVLAAANGISDPNVIQSGQTLRY